ncbi:DUF6099 family protein [Streptomyces sp. CA-278952]|uniref:DUF6099 family protein n=1 Tax=unclassified Streptomyces TaxID=2593676 RepID=UPI00037AAA9C|nr:MULTISPECIES: DUF6099 family protein [unclassified Streptomyces]UZI27900.1 DUF6099 family protein [Streptomyces sp. VB1]WDG28093.1 DUF6099 family protein [Streptomyces sp. CA-278952]
MEAERVIEAGRRALAGSRGALDVMAEAWQAQALARAVGSRLALYGPVELRSEARALGEIGAGCSALDHPTVLSGGARAAQLSEIADVRRSLAGLALLLSEAGIALVGVACDTGEDGLYWQCIEAMDAADESLERVHGMLRRLAERERERDGPYGGIRGPAASAAGP